MKNSLLVIDPIISSQYFINRAMEKKIDIIALKTFQPNNTYFDYENLNYKIITSSGNPVDDIKKLQDYHLIAGMYGNENSVEYADKILNLLFPNTSNKTCSKLRYNKFDMLSQLKKHNLPNIKQKLLLDNQSVNELTEIAYEYFCQNNHNIIIKPSSGSAGSQGVFSPSSKEEIVNYFQQGEQNFLFTKGNYILKQKIIGIEYYVDTASYRGKHKIVAIGRYKKNFISGVNQYVYAENLNIDAPCFEQFKKQVIEILTILGMDNGLSHLEFLENNEKYYLLEINPRISGAHGMINYMSKLLNSYDQIDALLDLIAGSQINNQTNAIFCRTHFIATNNSGYSYFDSEPFKKIQSFKSIDIIKPAMIDKSKANSLMDTAALVVLKAKTLEKLNQDSQKVYQIQTEGSCFK
ncbi:ATP-grasp domain-containing protein [Thiotrichales bacterium 19S3-7]|nr:ATP-grasp domain-containing protein [Thiotrichales bacterium 19S3-7]MCF6801848.1 ATP-grasp domain-containing protein [Thiotrichales bacterium 19S3-11]